MSLYYVQINLFCLVILALIGMTFRNKKGSRTAKGLAFTRLVAVIAAVCVFDLIAFMVRGRVFPGSRALSYFANITYDAMITLCGYCWLHYVDLHAKGLEYDHRRRQRITAIPLVIMLILLVTDPLTGWLFTVDAQNIYTRGNWIFLHWIISWGYLIYATVEAVIKMIKAPTRAARASIAPLTLFIIPCAVASALQMAVYGVTSTQCGMTIAVLFIASHTLTDEISRDTLTGLNNRRAFENYVTDQLRRAESETTILMCDIDRFKSINDTYGHAVGDLVLKRIAEVMKKVCGEYEHLLFLCRYGGDEFIICGFDITKERVQALEAAITRAVAEVGGDDIIGSAFGISIGHASGRCANYDDVEALIRLADVMMNRVKNEKSGEAR